MIESQFKFQWNDFLECVHCAFGLSNFACSLIVNDSRTTQLAVYFVVFCPSQSCDDYNELV